MGAELIHGSVRVDCCDFMQEKEECNKWAVCGLNWRFETT